MIYAILSIVFFFGLTQAPGLTFTICLAGGSYCLARMAMEENRERNALADREAAR
ncbi:hypothetical protein [Trueperella pyogenes]